MLIKNLFLGVGAMKSGTTWLYEVLGRHPSIYFSYEKEIHYFAHCHTRHINLNDQARIRRMKTAFENIDPKRARAPNVRQKLMWYSNYVSAPVNDIWYANLFSMRGDQKYCADFSNLHCHLDADGWDHVKSITENLKVLYLMRNPIDRLWSHVRFHLHVTGQFASLATWKEDDYLRFAAQPYIFPNGQYAAAVQRLRANLPADQLKIAFLEDVLKDSAGWLRDLENFLDIPRFNFTEELLGRRVNESPPMKMPPYFRDLFGDYAKLELKKLADLGLVLEK